MKKTQKITRSNYQRLISKADNYFDLDFKTGCTRFTFKNKDGFIFSYRFFRVGVDRYQAKSRLGHQKENYSFCGTLDSIFEHILNS